MVKNTTGGNKSKGFARKEMNVSNNNKLRLSDSEYEKYAHITKMFGNGMCQALCDDSKHRTCIIRGKFRGGKGKRNSFITVGTLVLVGVRDWETDSDKCDLLEVYSQMEVDQLKHHPKVPYEFICMNVVSDFITEKNNSGIEFSTIIDGVDDKPIIESKEEFVMDHSEEINIDDI
jgi:initiation factor 1A